MPIQSFLDTTPRSRCLAGFMLFWVGASGSLSAQVLLGTTVNASTGARIPGVELINAKGPRSLSDSLGKFILKNLPKGSSVTTVRRIGFRPLELELALANNDTLTVEVRLEPTITELAPLVVEAAPIAPGMEQFEERRRAGWGRFITGDVLRQSENRRLTDLLHEQPGVRVREIKGKKFALSGRTGDGFRSPYCALTLWLDGVRIFAPTENEGLPSFDLDEFTIQSLEGIEIYRGNATLPSEFGGTTGYCGAIVLWTRRPPR